MKLYQTTNCLRPLVIKKTVLGKLTKREKVPNGIEIQSGRIKLKVLFYKDTIFLVLLRADGPYTNPAYCRVDVGLISSNYKDGNFSKRKPT